MTIFYLKNKAYHLTSWQLNSHGDWIKWWEENERSHYNVITLFKTYNQFKSWYPSFMGEKFYPLTNLYKACNLPSVFTDIELAKLEIDKFLLQADKLLILI